MSLKAKLEAVIYAAEEPVTLAQLAVLFAGEALEWKAEQMPALLAVEAVIDPVIEAGIDPAPDPVGERADETPAETSVAAELSEPEDAAAISEPVVSESVVSKAVVETTPAEQDPASMSAEEAELEARRLERKRDRDAREILRGILDELIADYAADARGVEIREIAGGFRMGTKPEMHDAVRAFVKSLKPPMKLSLPALETLAVIAYKQPVTAPEVGEIRGVDSAGVLGSLMSRKLIATAGRKQVVGRPMLYKTTKEFLLRFGLKDLNELPSMEEFEKMAALELSEGDEIDEGAAQTGDLFAESESATVPAAGTADIETDEPEAVVEMERPQAEEAVTPEITPAAESSQEAADEQAPVERQDEEIEVRQ
jgi:segregation and condensation protein B